MRPLAVAAAAARSASRRVPTVAPTLALVVVVALTGCQAATPAPAAGTSSGTATTGASPSTTTDAAPSASTTTATTAPPSDPDTLTMAFAGDVHFEDYLAPLARDPHGLDELQSSLGAADLAMVNLETAITERGTKIGKEFHFRAPASALETIKSAGIDAVSMANNHGVDYGPVGLKDTLAAKQASPVPIVGIGKDEDEAFAPAAVEVLAAPPFVEPVEQEAVRVTARAAAVTAASGRMSAECRSP